MKNGKNGSNGKGRKCAYIDGVAHEIKYYHTSVLKFVRDHFGKDKIPELFRGAGQAKKAFNEGMNESLPEDSGKDKVEGPMEGDGAGDIDGDGISDSEDDEPRKTDYDSMTVAQLKEVLKEKGMTVSGKKADLIARLKK